MKAFTTSLENTVWRFYLLMAIVIVAFFAGVPILASLAFPVFLLAMLGISLKPNTSKLITTTRQETAKTVSIHSDKAA